MTQKRINQAQNWHSLGELIQAFPKVLLVARQCWKFVSSKSKCLENVTNIDLWTRFVVY